MKRRRFVRRFVRISKYNKILNVPSFHLYFVTFSYIKTYKAGRRLESFLRVRQ